MPYSPTPNVAARHVRPQAFTLSELLVSLSVLGLIASFAIPSILYSLDSSQKKARFKEAFNVLSTVVKSGTDFATLLRTGDMAVYGQTMNALKVCTNAQAQGCWTGSNASGNVATSGAVSLQTGAVITGFESTATTTDRVFIDINGASEPNLLCQDQFPVVISVGNNVTFEGVTLRLGETRYSSVETGFAAANSCKASDFPA